MNSDVLHTIGVKETVLLNNLKNKDVLCKPHEKHIRALSYTAGNNRRKTGRQARKRETTGR